MSYKTCPDCGSRVYNFGCVNCNEEDYIEEQKWLDEREAIEREEQSSRDSAHKEEV